MVMWEMMISYAYAKMATSDGGLPSLFGCRMMQPQKHNRSRSGNERQEQDLFEL